MIVYIMIICIYVCIQKGEKRYEKEIRLMENRGRKRCYPSYVVDCCKKELVNDALRVRVECGDQPVRRQNHSTFCINITLQFMDTALDPLINRLPDGLLGRFTSANCGGPQSLGALSIFTNHRFTVGTNERSRRSVCRS